MCTLKSKISLINRLIDYNNIVTQVKPVISKITLETHVTQDIPVYGTIYYVTMGTRLLLARLVAVQRHIATTE